MLARNGFPTRIFFVADLEENCRGIGKLAIYGGEVMNLVVTFHIAICRYMCLNLVVTYHISHSFFLPLFFVDVML